MLTSASRSLMFVCSVLYAILGAILFFLPEQMAPVFAWKVTGFMTMTIGGWCLGNAWLAFFAARRREWKRVYPALIYFWSFGILESCVVILFRAKLQLAHPIAWLYLCTLAVNALVAVLGIADWLRLRPARSGLDNMTGPIRFFIVGFVVFVGFLALYGLTVQDGGFATNGEIFPEPMSPFTLRSFGAFYLSLTLGMVPLLFDKDRAPFLNYGFMAVGLIVIITAAAFAYLRLFDFSAHPLSLLYFAAYLVSGIVSVYFLWKNGTGVSGTG